MTNKRFQRPINQYNGSEDLLYKDKYQKDSQSVPKIAISSAKIDGDFNYVIDAVNTLDEDVKSIVYSGIANQTILKEHISDKAVSEEKIADNAISTNTLKDSSITTNKISDLAITTNKIANNSITKDKISLNSIGTQELIDNSITRDKLAEDALSDSVPVGTIAQFSAQTLPTGWILCNGATLSKNTYPQLVRFLTNSDITLEATIPNLNTNDQEPTKFAIKAFSDTAELATVDIAELTQDLAKLEPKVSLNSSKGEEVELWSGSAGANTQITLSESIDEFKTLILSANIGSFSINSSIPVSQFKLLSSSNVFPLDISNHINTQYIAVYLKDNKTIATAQRYSSITLNKVTGVK